jgi:hypothetical protein
MRKVKLYPERMRCRRCRNFIVWLCVERLYCSYRCAGLPRPEEIRPYPREHVLRNGEEKSPFDWPDDPRLLKALAEDRDPTARSYQCRHCRMWHIGHRRF